MSALRANFVDLIDSLLKGPVVPYLWGGDKSPKKGLDCSGLIFWAWRQVTGTSLPGGRLNTDGIWDRFEHIEDGKQIPGDLALYGSGKPDDPANHVMVLIDKDGTVAGMAGGNSSCTSIKISEELGARLKPRLTHKYRKDFIGWVRLPFEAVQA